MIYLRDAGLFCQRSEMLADDLDSDPDSEVETEWESGQSTDYRGVSTQTRGMLTVMIQSAEVNNVR